MITVRRLKDLLNQVDDRATVWAYEGEDIGIGITLGDRTRPEKSYWIRARDSDTIPPSIDTHTEGFDEESLS